MLKWRMLSCESATTEVRYFTTILADLAVVPEATDWVGCKAR